MVIKICNLQHNRLSPLKISLNVKIYEFPSRHLFYWIVNKRFGTYIYELTLILNKDGFPEKYNLEHFIFLRTLPHLLT